MFSLLENLDIKDYVLMHKYVLAGFILIGTLILKLLLGRREEFIRNDRNLLILYILFFIFFAGTRSIYIGVDTINYYYYFFLPATSATNMVQIIVGLDLDFFFEIIIALTAWTNNYNIFLFVVAIIMNVCFYKFVRKFTNYGKESSSLILFLFIVCGFSFLNLELNIVRNGLAIGFILLALFYAMEEKLKWCLLFFVIAYFFHRTTIIPFVLVVGILVAKKMPIKYYLLFYVLAIGLAAAGLGFHSIDFLSQLGNEDMANLSFDGDTEYRIGFRPDFVAYNTLFLILFVVLSSGKSKRDDFLIKFYILSSAIFFFNFNIPYSDRFGVYSWIIIPLLLFNTVNERFPEKRVFYSTIVLISYYLINNVILFS